MFSKKGKSLLGFILLLLMTSPAAIAQNNQTFVIGFGIGAYTYEDNNLKNTEDTYYGSEFLEWYLFGEVGLGLRTHKLYKTGSSDSDEEILMANLNYTVNWVFLGTNEDFRMTFYAGYGPGWISYSNEKANIDITETANTSSGGIFLDWGGKTWGARLGFHIVSASFEYKEDAVSGTVNGSGSSVDIGVRLAF